MKPSLEDIMLRSAERLGEQIVKSCLAQSPSRVGKYEFIGFMGSDGDLYNTEFPVWEPVDVLRDSRRQLYGICLRGRYVFDAPLNQFHGKWRLCKY